MRACPALAGALLLLCGLPVQAATEVISLHYQMAEELLPVARSILGSQGRVTAYGNQLIVNAPDSLLDELKQTLQQLDRKPVQLLVSVDTRDNASSQNSSYRVDGATSPGEPRWNGQQRSDVRIIRYTTSSADSGTRQVRVTEGYPALIQVGQQVPLQNAGTDAYGRYYQNTRYQTVMQGFYVTAVLSGKNQVTVTLSSRNDRVSHSNPDVLDLQDASTRVSGPLGEWLSFAGNDQGAPADRDHVVRHYATQGLQSYSLRLKVDVLSD